MNLNEFYSFNRQSLNKYKQDPNIWWSAWQRTHAKLANRILMSLEIVLTEHCQVQKFFLNKSWQDLNEL